MTSAMLPPLITDAGQHRFSYRFRLVETVLESTAYRWIPWRAWPPFEQAFEAAQSQLRTALSQYQADYSAIRESVVGTFAELAADSARRLQATGQPVAIDFEDTVVREVLAAL